MTLSYFLYLFTVCGTDGVSTAPQWPLHPPHTPLPGGLSWHCACVDYRGTFCTEYYLQLFFHYILSSHPSFSHLFFFITAPPSLFSHLPYPSLSLLFSLLLFLLLFHLLSCPPHTFTWHTFLAKW